jgi:hypothetical protein
MDGRLKFVVPPLDGENMAGLCRKFGYSMPEDMDISGGCWKPLEKLFTPDFIGCVGNNQMNIFSQKL